MTATIESQTPNTAENTTINASIDTLGIEQQPATTPESEEVQLKPAEQPEVSENIYIPVSKEGYSSNEANTAKVQAESPRNSVGSGYFGYDGTESLTSTLFSSDNTYQNTGGEASQANDSTLKFVLDAYEQEILQWKTVATIEGVVLLILVSVLLYIAFTSQKFLNFLKLLLNPAIVGISTFAVSLFIIGSLLGPSVCHDGWESPSIGRRGACSHHGGVDGSKGIIKLVLSLGVAALAIKLANKIHS